MQPLTTRRCCINNGCTDFNDLVIEAVGGGRPSLVSVTEGMFCGGAKIVFVGDQVSGVSITQNEFMGGGRETNDGDCTNNDALSLTHGVPCGSWDTVAGASVSSFGPDTVIIADNLAHSSGAKPTQYQRVTRMTRSQVLTNATEVTFAVNAPPNTPGYWLYPGVPLTHIQHSFTSATDWLDSPMVARCGCVDNVDPVARPRIVQPCACPIGKNETLAVIVGLKPGSAPVSGSVTLTIDQGP